MISRESPGWVGLEVSCHHHLSILESWNGPKLFKASDELAKNELLVPLSPKMIIPELRLVGGVEPKLLLNQVLHNCIKINVTANRCWLQDLHLLDCITLMPL